MNAVEVLKSCALFRGFTDTGLQILASIATERNYPKGVPLFVENMVGDSLLIVAEGRVRLTAHNATGQEVPLGEFHPGDHLGELSLIQQGQRQCTATAAVGVVALELRHADFQRLLGQKPQACMKLLMAITATFAQTLSDNRAALRTLLPKA